MKTLCAAIIACIACTPALAEDDWKNDALKNIADVYPRIKDASWSEAGSLWLFAYDADVSWETVTTGLICLHLTSAGKPEGQEVLVSWFDHAAALQGQSNRLATTVCE